MDGHRIRRFRRLRPARVGHECRGGAPAVGARAQVALRRAGLKAEAKVPELSLNDRLQPALLDRLLDDERSVALVHVAVQSSALERLKLPVAGLLEILHAQGLTLERREVTGDSIDLHFTAGYTRTN